MFDKIRKILLLIIAAVVVSAGFYLYESFKKSSIPIKINVTESGASVEIENFKIVHENAGRTDWELQAQHAKVDQHENVTYMRGVRLEYFSENRHRFFVSADNGKMKNDSKEFELDGHVRLITESGEFFRDFRAERAREAQAKSKP